MQHADSWSAILHAWARQSRTQTTADNWAEALNRALRTIQDPERGWEVQDFHDALPSAERAAFRTQWRAWCDLVAAQQHPLQPFADLQPYGRPSDPASCPLPDPVRLAIYRLWMNRRIPPRAMSQARWKDLAPMAGSIAIRSVLSQKPNMWYTPLGAAGLQGLYTLRVWAIGGDVEADPVDILRTRGVPVPDPDSPLIPIRPGSTIPTSSGVCRAIIKDRDRRRLPQITDTTSETEGSTVSKDDEAA